MNAEGAHRRRGDTMTDAERPVVERKLLEAAARVRALEAERDMLFAALKHAERFCPCGARPEAPHTHPHVGGCPIGDAIAKVEGTP